MWGSYHSTSGVCRYVSSQVNSIHVCICAFSMYVGEQYAFGVVSGGVRKTPVHQQTWIVPALVGDVSFVVSDVIANIYMYVSVCVHVHILPSRFV